MRKPLIFIVLFLTSLIGKAQESVEEPMYFKDDYSIIRELNQDESLIYNCYQGSSTIHFDV